MKKTNVLVFLPSVLVALGYYFDNEKLFNVAIGINWIFVSLAFSAIILVSCFLIILNMEEGFRDKVLNDLFENKKHEIEFLTSRNSIKHRRLRLLNCLFQIPLITWLLYNNYMFLGIFNFFILVAGYLITSQTIETIIKYTKK